MFLFARVNLIDCITISVRSNNISYCVCVSPAMHALAQEDKIDENNGPGWPESTIAVIRYLNESDHLLN